MNILAKLQTAASIPPFLARLNRIPQNEVLDLVMNCKAISPYQVRAELEKFAALVVDLKPRTVLEIGTCRGGTLCLLSRLAVPDATIISVDLPGGPFGGGYNFVRESLFKLFPQKNQELHLIKADSHSPYTKHRVLSLLNNRALDLLFIDGDHTYEGVSKDFWVYGPLVRPGGLIALHDIAPHRDTSCEVSRFWEEIKAPRDIEIIADHNQGWGGIGVTYR